MVYLPPIKDRWFDDGHDWDSDDDDDLPRAARAAAREMKEIRRIARHIEPVTKASRNLDSQPILEMSLILLENVC